MPSLPAPRTRKAFNGNLRSALDKTLVGMNRIIAYHAGLTPGLGSPRVWPTSEDAAVIAFHFFIENAIETQRFPPAQYPA